VTSIPTQWVWARLKDLVSPEAPICYGVVQPGEDSRDGVPLVRVCDLTNGTVDATALRMISEQVAASYERSKLKGGEVLVSLVGTIGRTAIVPNDLAGATIARAIARITLCHPLRPWWLHFWLSTPRMQTSLVQDAREVARKTLNIAQVRNLLVPVAPEAEQRRIVDKIEALSAKSRRAKAALDAVPPLLERFRQSILAAAFRGDLTADWRAKNPDVEHASKLLERIRTERRQRWEAAELEKLRAKGKPPTDDRWKAKYEEPEAVDTEGLPELPEGWAWASVEEICRPGAPAVYGIILPGDHIPNGVPYIRPADIDAGRVDANSLKCTTLEIAANYSRSSLKENDIVLSIVGTIGKVLVVPKELDGANITQSSARIRPVDDLSVEFLRRALQSPLLTSQFDRYRFGNAVQRLNVEHVRALAVPVAPPAEQAAVVDALARIDVERLGSTLSRMRADLTKLNSAILAKAFRGELVPQDPNDEPASTLLERIRAEREVQSSVETPKRKGKKRALKPEAAE
jgi:type I restriction enzyme, S subunit